MTNSAKQRENFAGIDAKIAADRPDNKFRRIFDSIRLGTVSQNVGKTNQMIGLHPNITCT